MTVEHRNAEFDVIVIGGGINGTGVARDATLRGAKVALFERNDLAFGASGNSSGLIHGGPRYMTRDPGVTYKSCLDSGHIQRIAPHLLFRVPFVVPIAKGRGSRTQLDLFDAFFGVYDRYQSLKQGKPHTRLTAEELRELEPGLVGEFEGAVTFDEWGIDGSRLCIANAVDAHERGAQVHLHTTVTGLLRNGDGSVFGVRYRKHDTGELGECHARCVVNATGAWAPLMVELGKLPEKSIRLRPGKGIHVYYDRRLSNVAIVTKAVDGRQIFILPWQNTSSIATTDDDYYGDLDNVFATADEARYLIEGIAHIFPGIASARPIGTWAGVRPTLFQWGKPEDTLSREHEIVDHTAHGARGLYSMLGGKLASYRLFAEEMADQLALSFQWSGTARTHQMPLPGGEDDEKARTALSRTLIDPVAQRRLLYRHGDRAERVAELCQRTPALSKQACVCEPVTWAEVEYVVANEWARDVDMVARRTRLGLGACGGMRCAAQCGARVARMLDLPPERGRAMAWAFLKRQTRHRLPVLDPTGLRQEALMQAELYAQLGDAEGPS